MNNLKKENLKFQEEIKTARRAEEKAIKRVEEFTKQFLQPFGNNLCRVLDIPLQ